MACGARGGSEGCESETTYRAGACLVVHIFPTLCKTILYASPHIPVACSPTPPCLLALSHTPTSQVVFIGKNLNRKELLEGLQSCLAAPAAAPVAAEAK